MCVACGNPRLRHEDAPPTSGGTIDGADKPVLDLNGAIWQLTTQWGGSEGTTRTWQNTGVVYYSIPTKAPDLSTTEARGFKQMSALMTERARLAFELWDDVTALTLTENTSNRTDITFAYSSRTSGGGTYARSYTGGAVGSDYDLQAARIWLNSTWTSHDTDADMYFGGYGFITYVHEIGHALGLSHPGTYNAGSGGTITYAGNAEYQQDTRQFTVMSYFDADEGDPSVDHYGSDGRWKYAQTPLLHDVAAIQAKYGADTTSRTGDTTYGFGSNAGRDVYDFAKNVDPIICIWDAGGNDTLNASGYATSQRISLVSGDYSDIGHMTKNVVIAFGATIENAVGGSGNDILIGNGVANRLTGGAGNDALTGGAGADQFVFGSGFGQDRVTDFQDGIDLIRFAGIPGVDDYTDLAITTNAQGWAVVTVAGNTVTLEGVSASQLSSSDFLFG